MTTKPITRRRSDNDDDFDGYEDVICDVCLASIGSDWHSDGHRDYCPSCWEQQQEDEQSDLND